MNESESEQSTFKQRCRALEQHVRKLGFIHGRKGFNSPVAPQEHGRHIRAVHRLRRVVDDQIQMLAAQLLPRPLDVARRFKTVADDPLIISDIPGIGIDELICTSPTSTSFLSDALWNSSTNLLGPSFSCPVSLSNKTR